MGASCSSGNAVVNQKQPGSLDKFGIKLHTIPPNLKLRPVNKNDNPGSNNVPNSNTGHGTGKALVQGVAPPQPPTSAQSGGVDASNNVIIADGMDTPRRIKYRGLSNAAHIDRAGTKDVVDIFADNRDHAPPASSQPSTVTKSVGVVASNNGNDSEGTRRITTSIGLGSKPDDVNRISLAKPNLVVHQGGSAPDSFLNYITRKFDGLSSPRAKSQDKEHIRCFLRNECKLTENTSNIFARLLVDNKIDSVAKLNLLYQDGELEKMLKELEKLDPTSISDLDVRLVMNHFNQSK